MSKKLLLNNHVVNGLSPVQDGLVCWLDAFDLTTYEINSIWEDRSSYKNNGIVSAIYDKATITNGVLNVKSVLNIPNPTKELTNYTVEIGYEDVILRYWCGLWGNTSKSISNNPNGISIYQGDNSIGLYPLDIVTPSFEGLRGGKNYITFTFSSSELIIYINGVKFNTLTYTDERKINPSNANYLCFMSRKVNTVDENTTNGADMLRNNWYFIRIYNKTLTQEEVIFNYNYELSLQRG